jgi:hypothetical protein
MLAEASRAGWGIDDMKFTATALALALAATAATASAETFKFVAIGDMPYGDPPEQVYPRYRELIKAINARGPAFTIHIGDIKKGSVPCADALLQEQLDFLNSFDAALVYTPGDNEWTDCHRELAGRFDPFERLAKLRAMFFAGPQSLGKAPITLERQSELMVQHRTFVENARFARAGVQFVTLHVVGSNNGLESPTPGAPAEFFERDAANIAWLRDTFARARQEGANALVVAMQADMFDGSGSKRKDENPAHPAFANILEALVAEAAAFGKPVLLVYGDSHNFRVHTPFRNRAPALIGLEVFGDDQMHAVEVGVDTDDPAVFSFRPIWNPAK